MNCQLQFGVLFTLEKVTVKNLSRNTQVTIIIYLQKLSHSSHGHISSGLVVLQHSSILDLFWPIKCNSDFYSFIINDIILK